MTLSQPDWWAALGPFAGALKPILAVADSRGERLALVGGGVRDIILGVPLHDLDLVLDGDAVEMTRSLARTAGGEVRLHPGFGTATWAPREGASVDIASSRREHYSRPGALPEVSYAPLEDDLERRDFSINAMALILGRGEVTLLDPHGGQEDLIQRQLRVLHERSFIDDPCRIWRGLRFAARLGLCRSPMTETRMEEALEARALDTLSLQRLGAELDRCLTETDRGSVIALGTTWGLWSRLSEELVDSESLDELAQIPVEEDRSLAWLGLAAGLSESERERLRDLVPGASDAQRQWSRGDSEVRTLLESGVLSDLSKRPSEVGPLLEGRTMPELELLRLRGDDAVVIWLDWWRETGATLQSSIDGARLMDLGIPQGPAIGRGKAAALAAARDGEPESVQLERALRVAEST